MAILGTLLKKGIRLRDSLEQEYSSPFELQKVELKKLLIKAAKTEFGRKYKFSEILKEFKKRDDSFYRAFAQHVPIYNYEKIYNEWWYRLKAGEKNITWPEAIRYFALTSGTSGASSKYIPISNDMVKAIRRTGVRQILSLSKYDLPDELFTKGILMLGGSTDLEFNGTYFSGDLSGITTGRLPIWFQTFYKPGKQISKNRDWGEKLEQIVEKAPKWDIGIIVGVPAWLQILMEKIIERYQLKTIHDIWPNLRIYVHGGVSFEPYKKGFEKLMAKPLIYMETYLASEGFLAFQALPEMKSMRLVLNNGIFHEFIPFNESNFDENGEIHPDAKILKIDEVEEGKDYALLISTCAGAWRYQIGDVIRFVSKEESEIVITGRTKHFLSLCGEHLSVDNMNKAIHLVEEELNLDIREFTVLGLPHGTLFAHHWFAGTDNKVDEQELKDKIDGHLKVLNDDYAVERKHALKEMRLSVVPAALFYGWLKVQGKEGGQNKFPRVLKGDKMKSWLAYLQENGVEI
ncbi:GH3 auxin-responsive promoter family protein [Aquiflexum sp.]|uniref:GH3 family domain-containing protein n=1 Tax=Aquiflexum sp. TaxID=1872584 RepID=UPI003593B2DD